jgi:hypothetical protein
VDAVLGLAMTPSSIGLVLVEGNDVDGFTMDHDAVEIMNSEDATAAVLRSEALAATRGLRLKSIGLTWSDDADAEASMLMQSLSESGFDNVVPVRFPEANEAVARGIADALGCGTTAVCTIEPEFAITMIVHTASGAVHTAVNHSIGSRTGLTSWLSAVFARADWQPEALVVIGSAGNFESLLPGLQDALAVPVFTPEEADLALARGAALVSVRSGDSDLSEPYYFGDVPRPDEWAGQDFGWDPTFDAFEAAATFERASAVAPVGRHRSGGSSRWQQVSSSPALPLTMLAVGSTAFVASVSMAVTMQFLPSRGAAPASVTKNPQPAAAEQAVARCPHRSRPRCPTRRSSNRRRLPSSNRHRQRILTACLRMCRPPPPTSHRRKCRRIRLLSRCRRKPRHRLFRRLLMPRRRRSPPRRRSKP